MTQAEAISVDAFAHLPSVHTTLNYQTGGGIFYRLDQSRTSFTLETHPVDIRDARPIAGDLSLDEQGFVIVNAPSAICDLGQPGPARELYNREVAAIVNDLLGVSNGITFHTVVRSAANVASQGVRAPIHLAHNDYVEETWRDILQPELDAIGGDADALLAGHWAVINVWRPFETVESEPLALCDAQTIEPDDFIPSASAESPEDTAPLRYGNPIRHRERHRWFYFPQMTRDEAVVFVQCDTRKGKLGATPHSAFADPNTPANARQRSSIESRVFVALGPR